MNRLLGVGENRWWLLDQKWSFNFVTVARIRGAIDLKQLTDALAWMQRRYPLLAVRIVAKNGQPPRFVSGGVPPIPLRVVKRLGDDHWCQEAEAEMPLHFSWSTGPLVRVVLLQSAAVSELMITCHHALGDGLSSIYLLRDILQEMTAPGSRSEIFPERPSWDELIPGSQSSINSDAIALEAPTEEMTAFDADVVFDRASNQEVIQKSKRTTMLHWSLSPEETAMLVSRCREKQATVQGAMFAAFLLSTAEVSIAQEMDFPGYGVRTCLSPINSRNYLVPKIGEEFGLYVWGLITSHILKPETDFWELAQEVKSQLNDLIASGKMFEMQRAVKAFIASNPDPEIVYGAINKNSDVIITNLGRLNIPQQFGSLYVEEIYGPIVQSCENVKTVGVATLGGKMFLNFTFAESVLPRAIAEKIKTGAMRRITEEIGLQVAIV